MAKGEKRDKMDFPWEPGQEEKGGSPEVRKDPEPPVEKKKGPPAAAFQGEKTREYLLSEGFETPSARSEIALDSPAAAEATREVEIPKGMVRERRKIGPGEDKWPEPVGVKARLRKRFYEDPLVRWYMAFPAGIRQNVSRALWIISACWLMVAIYMWSSMVVYPVLEGYLRPAIAPKPEHQLRVTPREGLAFDLAEEREYDGRKFKMGTDCIWLVKDPSSPLEVVGHRLSLVHDGKSIAELDVRENWDGLLRVYFGVGELIPKTPVYIRLPVKDGGMWAVTQVPEYTVLRQGGAVPPHFLVGPVYFSSN
jgi:hypothetical protein